MVRKLCRPDLGLGLNKGAWTPQEHLLLKNYIQIDGGHWSIIPQKAGLLRCGRSCRLRWMKYLRSDVKHDNISADEEDLVIRLQKLLGNSCGWSLIAARIPGRTDNQINFLWYYRLSKKPAKKATEHFNVLKPVPYKYKLPSPNQNIVTATADIVPGHTMNDDPNDQLLFQPTNYASRNGEVQMKQAGAASDIEELIANLPDWLYPEAKDLTVTEMHNSFDNSNNLDSIMHQGFCWAFSSLSPVHFTSFLTSSTHNFQGTEYAHMASAVQNDNYVHDYDENQQHCNNNILP